MKKIVVFLIGLVLGVGMGLGVLFVLPSISRADNLVLPAPLQTKTVIGFLPYWLLATAKKDYSDSITTLTYFGLRIDSDGSIQKLTDPQEEEPGWYALTSGKLTPFFRSAHAHGVALSLLVSSGDDYSIAALIDQPVSHAGKFVSAIEPVLKKYRFSDLNIDIEYTGDASASSRKKFTQFMQAVRKNLDPKYTLTIEVTGDDLIKSKLIDPAAMGNLADNVVVMAYDYHYLGSFVTGPVAPLGGAGKIAEYDVTTAMKKAVHSIPPEKVILGTPLYGYEWETIGTAPRSAIIPGTGLTASNRRAEQFVNACASCSAQFDTTDQEVHVVYRDSGTGTYHQLFYPDAQATAAKINLANQLDLGGLALWALGYEGPTIINPLKNYR